MDVKLAAPTLKINVPANRSYRKMIEQTKTVYDQLLLKRRDALIEEMYDQKEEFDRQVNSVAARNEGKGLEIGVRAQEVLNKMQQKSQAELDEQELDYQQKLDKMVREMEKQFRPS